MPFFLVLLQRLWCSLEPLWWDSSNKYPQSMLLSQNKKNVYPINLTWPFVKCSFLRCSLQTCWQDGNFDTIEMFSQQNSAEFLLTIITHK